MIRIKTIEDFIESTQTTQPTWTDALDTILLHNSTEARGRVLLSGHGGLFNLYRQYESATIASMLKHVYQELLSIFSTWNIEVMHIVSCFSAGNRESFHRDDLGNPIRYPFDIVTHGMLSQTLTGEAMAPLFEALKYFSIGTNFDTKQVVTTYINQLPHTIEKPTNAVAYLRPHDSDSFELLPSHGLGRLLTKSNESNAVEISTGKCPQQQKKTLFIITTPIIDCTLEIAGGSILSTVSGQTSHFIKELLITYQNSIDEKTLFLHVMLELFNNFFAIKYTDSPGISSLTDEQDFCTKGYLIQKLTATAADATITFEPIFLLKSKPYFSEYDELPFFIIIANVNHRWVKITIKIKSDNKKIDSITLKETSQTKALNSIRRLFCKMEPQQSDVDSDHRKELSDKIFTSLRATSNSANTTLPDSSDTRLIARFMHEITTASISPTGGKDPYMQLVSKIAVHIKPLKQL